MALVSGSLQEWLTKSAYVRGRDQTSAVVGRKKCRAHRKGPGGGDEEKHDRISDRVVHDGSGKVSNRRYRRWLNDQLLRELSAPLDAAEIESLFAPPPWGEQRVVTPLEQIVGGGVNGAVTMAGWEPFRNVDMDTQAKWIRNAEESTRVRAPSGGLGKRDSAMDAWRGVERTAREALRRNSESPLLQAFEEKLLLYLSEAEAGEEKDDRELTVEAETSYHRLLLHGLTQFHGLVSRRVAVASSEEGKSVLAGQSLIMIKRRDPTKSKLSATRCSARPLNLVDFLRQVQRHPQVGIAV